MITEIFVRPVMLPNLVITPGIFTNGFTLGRTYRGTRDYNGKVQVPNDNNEIRMVLLDVPSTHIRKTNFVEHAVPNFEIVGMFKEVIPESGTPPQA